MQVDVPFLNQSTHTGLSASSGNAAAAARFAAISCRREFTICGMMLASGCRRSMAATGKSAPVCLCENSHNIKCATGLTALEGNGLSKMFAHKCALLLTVQHKSSEVQQ